MAVTSSLKHAMLTFLAGQAGPVTEADIKRGIIGDNRVKQTVLRALVAEGRVMRQGRGTRGQPYRFSLAATGAGSEHPGCEKPPATAALSEPCHHPRGFPWILTFKGWQRCRACHVEAT